MTLDKLTSALNQGGQHLGDLIWWTLAEADDFLPISG